MTSKKQKNPKEVTPERVKALREAYLRQAQTYKDRVRPLVQFLRKHQLKFNNAHVGNERIEYFRLDDFQKLISSQNQAIKANEQLNQLVTKAYNEFVFFKRPENIKIKYPKILEPVPSDSGAKKYASFRFDTTESKKGQTFLAISLVFVIVLFPIWPFTVKYALWLVSLVLLVVLVGIIVVRLLLFCLCIIFNYHVWIFPNLFFATGFLDSFLPVLEISKGDRSWLNICFRLIGIGVFVLLSVHIYNNPNFIDQTLQSSRITIQEVHDWGVSKIKNEGNFSQRALTNLDRILNQTAQTTQVKQQENEVDIEAQVQTGQNQEVDRPSEQQASGQTSKESEL